MNRVTMTTMSVRLTTMKTEEMTIRLTTKVQETTIRPTTTKIQDNQSPDNNDNAPGDDSHGYDNGDQQQRRGVDNQHNDDQMSQAQGGESEQPAHVADEDTMWRAA